NQPVSRAVRGGLLYLGPLSLDIREQLSPLVKSLRRKEVRVFGLACGRYCHLEDGVTVRTDSDRVQQFFGIQSGVAGVCSPKESAHGLLSSLLPESPGRVWGESQLCFCSAIELGQELLWRDASL